MLGDANPWSTPGQCVHGRSGAHLASPLYGRVAGTLIAPITARVSFVTIIYLTLMGDINQMPFIDRNDLFPVLYHRPTPSAKITREQLCTHRNPLDVAYAMSDVYSGIYSSKNQARSLELKRYSRGRIPTELANTLYLTHTQSEKESLIKLGCVTTSGVLQRRSNFRANFFQSSPFRHLLSRNFSTTSLSGGARSEHVCHNARELSPSSCRSDSASIPPRITYLLMTIAAIHLRHWMPSDGMLFSLRVNFPITSETYGRVTNVIESVDPFNVEFVTKQAISLLFRQLMFQKSTHFNTVYIQSNLKEIL
ncbi:hypothetical protein K1T71_005834 [Dendrolimus kikuchii]|uniref:Uncharacterized protein n=1 Tax=Dendrolimus kikuchii TaxID=765133 RepID=A0ACC1D546_9NEOP|nr:hypothetical protein K1T71_005834 [Dendrolimus kikuchii]